MNRKIDTLGFHLYDRWMRNIREGKGLSFFFVDNLYKKIAIYGMGLIGRQIYEELAGSGVIVEYAIDRNAFDIQIDDLEIVPPQNANTKTIEAIVVTPIDCFNEIERTFLDLYGDDPPDVISIETIVDYVSRRG